MSTFHLLLSLDLTFNFQSALDILALIQGVTLGLLLLILNYRHFRSTYWLGIYLILFSLKLLIFIPEGLQLDEQYPELFLLPFNFSWLLFAVFYVYTQKISILSDQKIRYWLLYPGILSFALQVYLYFQPYETKVIIAQSFWYVLVFTYLGILYSWGVGIWNLRLIDLHRAEVEDTFSELENKVLTWVRIFLIYSIFSSVFIHLLYFISHENYYFKIIFSLLDMFAIYWVAINGMIQQNVLSNLSKNDPEILSEYKAGMGGDSKKTNPDNQDLKDLMEVIDTYMKKSEAFLNTELTIVDLAEKLKMHPKRISTSINTISNQNFNSYVNELRIKKAQRILNNAHAHNYSIEGIGQEVGFHSKSAFYAAFKKVTGTTPTRFKED